MRGIDNALGNLRSNTAAFIDLVVVEEGKDVGAMGKLAGGFLGFDFLVGAVVFNAPAALLHELVPVVICSSLKRCGP